MFRGSFEGETISVLEGHFQSKIFLRGVELTLDSLTGYRVTAVAGAGESILSGGAASADGSGLTTPIATRRFIAGTGITITPAAGSLTVATTGYRIAAVAGAGESILSGGAASADGNGLTTPVDTRRLVAGTNVTLTPAAGSITINAAGSASGSSMYVVAVDTALVVPVADSAVTVPLVAITSQSAGANYTRVGDTIVVARDGLYKATLNGNMDENSGAYTGAMLIQSVYNGSTSADSAAYFADETVANTPVSKSWLRPLSAGQAISFNIFTPAGTTTPAEMFGATIIIEGFI